MIYKNWLLGHNVPYFSREWDSNGSFICSTPHTGSMANMQFDALTTTPCLGNPPARKGVLCTSIYTVIIPLLLGCYFSISPLFPSSISKRPNNRLVDSSGTERFSSPWMDCIRLASSTGEYHSREGHPSSSPFLFYMRKCASSWWIYVLFYLSGLWIT